MEKAYQIALSVLGPDHAADFVIWLGKYFPDYNVSEGVIKKYTRYYASRVRKKEAKRVEAEYVYSTRLPAATGPPDKIIELFEDLRGMSIREIRETYGVTDYKARRLKNMTKHVAKFIGIDKRVLPFRDGKHGVIFIKFDFGNNAVPSTIWKIKDTYAQYGRYERLFTNLPVNTECLIRFGSEKGKQAGRIVWAQPIRKERKDEADNSDVR